MSDQHGSGNSDSSGASAWNDSSEPPRGGDTWTPGPSSQEPRAEGFGGFTSPDSSSGSSWGEGTPGQPPSYSQSYGGQPYAQQTSGQPGPGQGSYPPGAYQGGYQGGGYQGGQYGAMDPYGSGPGMTPSKGAAIAALIFGVVAFLLGVVPFLAAVLGLVAIVLGVVALGKVRKGTGGGRGLAITGIVLGTIALVFNILLTVFLGGMVREFADCAGLPTQAQQEQCITSKLEQRGIDTGNVQTDRT